MISSVKSYLKFFVKIYILARLRSVLLTLFGARVNKERWGDRLLIVHLEGLGDTVALTSVLKHYKEDFPDKELYLLFNASSAIDAPDAFGSNVRRILRVDYRRFVTDPLYGLRFINELRQIGFKTVVTHDPSLAEVSGKFIVLDLGAEETIGYEGAFFQLVTPYDENMKMSVAYARKHLLPRFTKIIPAADQGFDFNRRKPLNYICHYIKSYETAWGKKHSDYSPTLRVPQAADESALALLREHNISRGTYCLLSLSTSTPHREWPAERFAEALSSMKSLGIPLVIVGGARDVDLIPRFREAYGDEFVNLAGKTSIVEYLALVHHALFSLSNETAQAHIAIALKKPMLSVLGGGHLGLLSLYGYPHIHRFVYTKNVPCLSDNWRCNHTVGPNDPAPCIAAVSVEGVVKELESLLEYIRHAKNYPRESFHIEFAS